MLNNCLLGILGLLGTSRLFFLKEQKQNCLCNHCYKSNPMLSLLDLLKWQLYRFPKDLKEKRNQLFSSICGGGRKKTARMVWLANRWSCGLGLMDPFSIPLHLIKLPNPSFPQQTCLLQALVRYFSIGSLNKKRMWVRKADREKPQIECFQFLMTLVPDYRCLQMRGGF